MFNYDKIPNIKLTDIVKDVNPKIFKRMPETLSEFCKGVEEDDRFYSNHSTYCIGTRTLTNFHNQIYAYLESLGAVEYSIETSLPNACIESPLGITYMGRPNIVVNDPWRVKDISMLYNLQSGKLWLPPHHEAKITQFGKVPETVAGILRKYVKFALKCKDKDFSELAKELETLAAAGVLDEEFFKEILKGSAASSSASANEGAGPSFE